MLAYHAGRNVLNISHLLYADDVFLFTNGSCRSLTALMSLLHSYDQSSGQLINTEKSGFYIGSKAEHRVTQIT